MHESSPRNGLFKREPDIVGANASGDRHQGLRTLLRYLANGSKPSSAQTSAKSRMKPWEKAVRVPGGFPAGLPLWPGGHRVGLPTSARLEFIRVYA